MNKLISHIVVGRFNACPSLVTHTSWVKVWPIGSHTHETIWVHNAYVDDRHHRLDPVVRVLGISRTEAGTNKGEKKKTFGMF